MRRTEYLASTYDETIAPGRDELPEQYRQNVLDTLKWFCYEQKPDSVLEEVTKLFNRTPHCRLLRCDLDDAPSAVGAGAMHGTEKSSAIETPFFSEVSDLRSSIVQLTIRGWSGLPGDPKLNVQLSVSCLSDTVWKTVYGDMIEYSELWNGQISEAPFELPTDIKRSEAEMERLEPIITGLDDDVELGFEKMVSEVVHEVRNPLGSIMTAVGLVIGKAGEPLEDEDCHLLSMIESESERIDRILRNFVDSVKPIALKRERADVRALALQSLRESVFADDDIVDVVEMFDHSGSPAFSAVDTDLVKGMLDYLTQDLPETIPGCSAISFECSTVESELRLDFKYSGDGIRPDLLRKVVLPSNAAKDGGSGLNEIPPNMVVMAHGGRMRVHSENSLTVLTVWMPLAGN